MCLIVGNLGNAHGPNPSILGISAHSDISDQTTDQILPNHTFFCSVRRLAVYSTAFNTDSSNMEADVELGKLVQCTKV